MENKGNFTRDILPSLEKINQSRCEDKKDVIKKKLN